MNAYKQGDRLKIYARMNVMFVYPCSTEEMFHDMPWWLPPFRKTLDFNAVKSRYLRTLFRKMLYAKRCSSPTIWRNSIVACIILENTKEFGEQPYVFKDIVIVPDKPIPLSQGKPSVYSSWFSGKNWEARVSLFRTMKITDLPQNTQLSMKFLSEFPAKGRARASASQEARTCGDD